MKKNIYILTICFLIALSFSCKNINTGNTKDQVLLNKADSLLKLMTLEEKIGQLNHLAETDKTTTLAIEIRKGNIGAITAGGCPDTFMCYQKIAVTESRLKIPLLLGLDIIHGFKTSFPVPIAQASSWDMNDIKEAEHIAAIEATKVGINWTFSPMIDVARDPRWGRVMEGSGEDTYLACQVAKSRVRGFQGENLNNNNSLLACAKHFAGYSCVEGGKEYSITDISERALREIYLPPFKAAVDEGLGTVMNAFTLFDGIPASASKFLVHDVLKREWNFSGFTVSDAKTFYEVIPWGAASDSAHAAELCMNASSDMDLWANIYSKRLPELVKSGKIKESQIDDAARRILFIKFKMGLFENPYRAFTKDWEKNFNSDTTYHAFSIQFARKCLVLLKNEKNTLPLNKNNGKIAIIGQLADSREYNDYIGTWNAWSKMDICTTLLQGIKNKVSQIDRIISAKGCNAKGDCPNELINEAYQKAKHSDIIVLALGENGSMSGENQSRSNIELPGNQDVLINKLAELNKPIVLVVFAGRPLVLTKIIDKVDAILYVWQPGALGGAAIADVLFGDYNPTGKITMTFPYATGQVPIYYNHFNTGFPENKGYRDCPNEPLFPFGFGLSYTKYSYSDFTINSETIKMHDTLLISVKVKNTGNYDGEEIVQLYTQDMVGSVVRPVKELKGFQKIFLKKGQEQKVEFALTANDLAFWNADMIFKAEQGKFKVFVGGSSKTELEKTFELNGEK